MSKSKDSKTKSDQMSVGRSIRTIGQFMRGQGHMFTKAGLLLAFEAATAVMIPLIVAYVIDYMALRLSQLSGNPVAPPLTPLGMLGLPPLINPDIDTILIATIGIIILTMVNSLADSMAEIYLAKGGRNTGYNLRVMLYAHLQKLSLAFHDQRRTGDIITRVTSDVAALEDFIVSSLSDFVGSVLLIVFILIVIIMNAWQVALVAAIIIPVMALVSNYFTSRIKAASKKRRASEGELASAAQEMLTSIRVIQTYGQGSYEQSMFAEQSQKAMDAALDAAAYQARFSWVVSVLGAVSTAAVIWMAVYLIFRAPITASGIGLLSAYIKYIQDMFKPTKRLIQEWNTFGKLLASIERIGDLISLKPAVQDEPNAVEAPIFRGRVEFRNLTFSYPSVSRDPDAKPRPALMNISFTVEPGQVVAVVGHTGAGKSTIVQFLPRLYDPSSGEVLIDGHNIKEFTLDSLRAQVSVVLQESILFSGSVVENIAYGRPDATGAEIIGAAKQANAHEFIEKFPEGYYTMLGERGSNLSGGQRQRIAIARAFIRNTPILVMDEPTTGLDAESTDLVLRALRKLMQGKTTIIISHDLNLIRGADKIVVIKAGEMEQMGTHEELLRMGGLYANLYTTQYGPVNLPAPAGAATEILIPQSGFGKQPSEIEMSVKQLIETIDYDLPHSAHFIKRLPALAEAFDGDRMKERLQQALFDNGNDLYTISSCQPGKAMYQADHTCNMQFELMLTENNTGQVQTGLVNARLFPDIDSAKKFQKKYLAPLVRSVQNRPEIRLFSKPAALIEPLIMVVSVFPLDGLLPTLINSTDPKKMLSIFNETLPEALSGELTLQIVNLELAHYGRYQRCVLRYRIDSELTDSRKPQDKVVYGKVDADGQGGLTVSVIGALREKLREPGLTSYFRVPQSYGYLPDLKLLLMEALPGDPVIKRLIKEGNDESDSWHEGDIGVETAMDICAQMLVTLHSSGIKLGRRNSLELKAGSIMEEIKIVQEVYPELGKQLRLWMDDILEYAQASTAMPLCFSHGDFTYTQLIFDGKSAGLVDFDTVCQAEPGLDLGQFLAYQRLTILKDHPNLGETVDHLCDVFLNAYIGYAREWLPDEELLRDRVGVYELISLIRLVLHSWQKFKGSRLKLALTLFEERYAWLKQVS